MARASCGCGSRMERRDVRVSAAAAGRQHGSRLKQRKRLLRTLAACSFAAMMAESTQCPAHRAARWKASTAAVHGRQLRGGSKPRHEWASGSMNTASARSMRRCHSGAFVTLSGYTPAAELLRWHGEGAGWRGRMLRLLESSRQNANGWECGAKAAEAGDCT